MCAVTSSRRSSGRDGLQREALDDGEGACRRSGSGSEKAPLRPTSAATSARGKLASQVTSTIQAGRPVAATRPGRPMPGGSGVPRVSGAERLELASGARGTRCSTACSGSCSPLPAHVDVADGPARPAADVLDARVQGVVDRLGLGGGGGDGLDQRRRRPSRSRTAPAGGSDGGADGEPTRLRLAAQMGDRRGRGAARRRARRSGRGVRLVRGSGHLPRSSEPSAT